MGEITVPVLDPCRCLPEYGPLVGPLPYEEHAPPGEGGGVGGQTVDAGQPLLLQQLVLRHQAVLQEIGTVAVRALHTKTQWKVKGLIFFFIVYNC